MLASFLILLSLLMTKAQSFSSESLDNSIYSSLLTYPGANPCRYRLDAHQPVALAKDNKVSATLKGISGISLDQPFSPEVGRYTAELDDW